MSGYAKVYRSSHPDVLAHRDAWVADQKANGKAIDALKRWLRKEGHLVKGQELMLSYSSFTDAEPIGLSVLDYRNIPEAWRLVKGNRDYLAPRKNHPVGKAIAAKFAAVKGVTDPRRKLPGLSLSLNLPGLEAEGDTVYLLFGTSTGGTPDAAFWEQIKLSEYYAAKEAAEVSA